MISSEYIAISPDNEKLSLTLEVGLPEPDPNGGDYRCKICALALEVDEYVYGVDAIQSYCLVSKRLKMLFSQLISEGWKFYFPGYLDMEIDFLAGYF
ncbi:hypothetical protein SG34_013730 [Thalassomonas viridans]|uniref:Uncharacterized protein n=1 Tax=Thalassomonas viridans TaxID=137584 RepID=A0AAF0CBJ8_9GAMM|nr:hypothetical protein [Thalassomonas viridans]WDE07843.1 hypothetical protein SG34_013730 [Thalassomonas viridans]